MQRREFLQAGLAAVAAGGAGALSFRGPRTIGQLACVDTLAPRPPIWSVIPVVGDGKWIWTKPPAYAAGYLEPRTYEVEIGVEIEGAGRTTQVMAATPVPVEQPEQKIENVRVETQGCQAKLRALSPTAGQLIVAGGPLLKGQVIRAVAHLTMTLKKQYMAFDREQFPAEQSFDRDFAKAYLYDSPGIQTRQEIVRDLADKLAAGIEHPWDKAEVYYEWVWENIRARIGSYTSVVAAVRDRVGDCEERAAVFVALCRISGIPARLVWIPNHNWAEFYLKDFEGNGHWIPAHTSCYSWFGWTGAHELVIQKGDKVEIPEMHREQRLIPDWMRHAGTKPKPRYIGSLKPIATSPDEDAGPGARTKDAKGEWLVTGEHDLDRYLRDGTRIARR